ncbi:hypothetical protein [Acidovorax sp.]|uniref:hypothetical protein n=1 Tax=Acidovorax sp. TaxID=1872122 RepID=UPI00391B437D
MKKPLSPANRVMSAIWEGLVLGGIGAALIQHGHRFWGVCVILVAMIFAVWMLVPSRKH